MRGFFSTVVVGIAVILLIAIFYAQQSQQLSQNEMARSLVVQQSLSKEWFLARQAYSHFASDAIVEALDAQLTGPFSLASCSGPIATDFAPAVALRWNDVNVFLQQNVDVNCQAVISPTLELATCAPAGCPPYGDVRSQGDVFVELICSKNINGIQHQLAYPFTLNKKIELSWNAALSQCHVIVSDAIPVSPIIEVDHTLT